MASGGTIHYCVCDFRTNKFLQFALFSNLNERKKEKLSFFSDAYRNIFIDNGSPDSYLSSDINNFLNDSFNGTFNLSSTPISNRTDTNGDDDVTEYIVMIVTSVLLGLMILMTVIGKLILTPPCFQQSHFKNFIIANYGK